MKEMKNIIQFCFILSITTLLYCNKKQKNEYAYPKEVEVFNIFSKFDSAAYLIYKLNIEHYIGVVAVNPSVSNKQFLEELLNAKMFNGLIKHTLDTTKFCLLLIDKKNAMINPLPHDYIINTIAFVKDSIKFIEINDGAIRTIDNHNGLFLDRGFLQFVEKNKNYLSEDLKRVLKKR